MKLNRGNWIRQHKETLSRVSDKREKKYYL